MTIQGPKPGGWALNEVLTSSQLTALQTALERATDGVGGGTYNPSPALTLNNTKLQIPSFADLKLVAQNVTLSLPLLPAAVNTAQWAWDFTAGSWTQTALGDTGDDKQLMLPLAFAPLDVIKQVDVVVKPVAHGSLPTNRPSFNVGRQNIGAALDNVVVIGTDASADATAYSAQHTITWSGTVNVGATPGRHVLRILGESNTNSIVGLAILDVKLTVQRTQILSLHGS